MIITPYLHVDVKNTQHFKLENKRLIKQYYSVVSELLTHFI